MNDHARQKAELREKLRFRRTAHVNAMPQWEREVAFAHIPHPLRDALGAAGNVAVYCAVGAECDLSKLASELEVRGLAIAKPRHADRDDTMRFHRWRSGDPLEAGPFGVPQPHSDAPEVAPDLILCPLVGFDRALNRLGQGGGHYDRAFAAHPGAKRVGVAWCVQEVDALPLEAWDIPLNAVLTEREWIAAS